ncbi:MerR family transcriptional regulator [Nocardiopsis deserti]|uniref:MerR family transcriptional regulator n=1 Tax=Nocardiopsis deserti TaxID=2605988 RepID=UPI00123A6401|nr:MerR family transcriptional regulator [Nocardiopsis deserti]
MGNYYTPGQVAERFDLTLDTLRYYEKAGLLRRVERAPSGHRRYRTDDVEMLDMIRCLRETDMPIVRLREFAELIREGDHTVPDRLDLLQGHQERLDERMEEMRRCQKVIQHKIDYYRGVLAAHTPEPLKETS